MKLKIILTLIIIAIQMYIIFLTEIWDFTFSFKGQINVIFINNIL